LVNPSDTPQGALTDAFAIYEPGAHPMSTVWLHEHPRGEIKAYDTEGEARKAALQLARAWIDGHIG
jgi:hypothetical protein